jgi:hypothetical protein
MKTKMILLAALVGVAATSAMSANAGVRFGFAFGLPMPVVATAPVYVTEPVVPAAPAPIVEYAPACPGVDYVWTAGYWSYQPTGYVWIHGAWNYRSHVDNDDHARFQAHDYDNHRDNDRGYQHDDHRGDRR